MKTLLLDGESWNLVLDIDGNIAVASDPYSLAQDAASAIKTFLGEVYYDTTLGVSYFQQILGKLPPLPYLKAAFVAAAKTVPGVKNAVVFISSVADRTVHGQVQIVDDLGDVIAAASF